MKQTNLNPWKKEASDFARAFSGAFLFGIPLLFTMEMWWIGTYTSLGKLSLFFLITFILTVGINFAVGFKKESTFNSVFIEAINTTAVGVIASTIVLVILNRITLKSPYDSTLGKIIIHAAPLSIGASLGNSLLGQTGKSREGSEQKKKKESMSKIITRNIAASAIGGIFVGLTIAPTMEIPTLAAQLSFWHELSILIFSIGLSYIIVYESGFDPQKNHHFKNGYLRNPHTESAVAYIVSLVVAFGSLYFFDRIHSTDPIHVIISQVLVLGVPTTIGASAGRIVV